MTLIMWSPAPRRASSGYVRMLVCVDHQVIVRTSGCHNGLRDCKYLFGRCQSSIPWKKTSFGRRTPTVAMAARASVEN